MDEIELIQASDSLLTDTIAQDTLVLPPYQAKYIGGLDTETFPVEGLDSVKEQVSHTLLLDVPLSPHRLYAHDGVQLFLLFTIGLLFFARSRSYFSPLAMIKSLFETRTRTYFYHDNTVAVSLSYVVLSFQTFAAEALILLSYWGSVDTDFVYINFFPLLLFTITSFALYYFLLQTVYKFLVYVFSDLGAAQQWLSLSKNVNQVLGIVLFPIAIAMIFLPAYTHIILYIAFGFYIITRVIFIYKTLRFFFTSIVDLLYFFLYLCALEIAPVILVYQSAVILQSFVEFKILAP